MLVQNLRLSLKEKSEGKVILVSENGMEIILPGLLADEFTEKNKPLYLSLDYQPTPTADDDKKEVLNNLLGKD